MAESGADTVHQASQLATQLRPYLIVAAVFLAVIWLVPPRGDFPLNDDWIYAKVTRHLVETGAYEPNLYGDPTFILQAAWGALFVKVFGFSFNALRLSTLPLALAGAWGAVWCAREAGVRGRWAALAGLAVLVNPIYLNLSYTYMTDVPFLALATLSGGAFLRSMRTPRVRWVWIGSTLAVASFFIRQFGVLVPVAYLVTRGIQMWGRGRPIRWSELSATIVPWIFGLSVLSVLPTGGAGIPMSWDWDALGSTLAGRVGTMAKFLAESVTYMGLFLAPLLVLVATSMLFRKYAMKRAGWVAFISCVAAILLLTVWARPQRLPYLGNVLYDLGVGPLLLPGMVEGWHIAAPVRIGNGWWPITAAAIVLASIFVVRSVPLAINALKRNRRAGDAGPSYVSLFLVLWGLGMIAVLILPPIQARFDRYLLMALPPCVVLAALWADRLRVRPSLWTAGVLTALGLVFSVICLQDYLAWNRARWEGLDRLMARDDVPLDQINGGYEFNGWYHSDRFLEASRERGEKVFGAHGWWILQDDYCVSLRPRRHFEVIDRVPYFSWLGFATREMLVERRVEEDDWPR